MGERKKKREKKRETERERKIGQKEKVKLKMEAEGKKGGQQVNVEKSREKKSAIQELARTHEKTQVVATH